MTQVRLVVQRGFYKSVVAHGNKVTRKQVAEFLRGKDAYTLHKSSRKHYSLNPTIVADIDQQWQADLADVSQLQADNDKTRYILTVVDCFSNFAWVVPTKSKNMESIVQAFQTLFQEPRKAERLQTDKGKEFYNS